MKKESNIDRNCMKFLSGRDWANYLEEYSDLCDSCPWESFDGSMWVEFLLISKSLMIDVIGRRLMVLIGRVYWQDDRSLQRGVIGNRLTVQTGQVY